MTLSNDLVLRRFAAVFLIIAAFLAALPAQAASYPWNGTWKTTYGELRLVRDGDRVYGDYQSRGYIEGRLSQDGQRFRGTFQYTGDRSKAGTVEFNLTGPDSFTGHWSWASDRPASEWSKTSWSGTRTSDKIPSLRLAVGRSDYLADYFNSAPASTRVWLLDGVGMPSRQPAPRQSGVDPQQSSVRVPVYTDADGQLFGDEWQGTFTTTYGPIRLVQQGRRVFGEYAERGVFEGCIHEGGDVLRGTFQYFKPRTSNGFIEFRTDGDGFKGSWTWAKAGVPNPESKINWRGARSDPRISDSAAERGRKLNFADFWPTLDAASRQWVLGSDYHDACDAPDIDYGDGEEAFPGEMLDGSGDDQAFPGEMLDGSGGEQAFPGEMLDPRN